MGLSLVGNQQIKSEVMSLAEALQEEGRAEGRAEARREMLAGQVRRFERLLSWPERDLALLQNISIEELERELEALEREVQSRLNKK